MIHHYLYKSFSNKTKIAYVKLTCTGEKYVYDAKARNGWSNTPSRVAPVTTSAKLTTCPLCKKKLVDKLESQLKELR